MKLTEIAAKVGARLENCTEDVAITGVAPIEEASTGQIAFALSAKDVIAAKSTHASAVILPEDAAPLPVPMLRDANVFLIASRVLELLYRPVRYEKGIHRTAVIHESARIGANASIGAYVVIDREVEIGADAVLLPHVVIYRGARIGRNFFAHAHAVVREHCHLGDNVILQNGAIIGADGFGFANDSNNGEPTWKKVLHRGTAILGDNVEVQSNACVDRSYQGQTRIGREVKIGALALVAHESSIDERTLVLPQVALAGAARVGKEVTLLGQVGVVGNCTIGDGAVVMAKGLVMHDVASGEIVGGYPAMGHKSWLRSVALFKRLPELTRAWRANGAQAQSLSSVKEARGSLDAGQ